MASWAKLEGANHGEQEVINSGSTARDHLPCQRAHFPGMATDEHQPRGAGPRHRQVLARQDWLCYRDGIHRPGCGLPLLLRAPLLQRARSARAWPVPDQQAWHQGCDGARRPHRPRLRPRRPGRGDAPLRICRRLWCSSCPRAGHSSCTGTNADRVCVAQRLAPRAAWRASASPTPPRWIDDSETNAWVVYGVLWRRLCRKLVYSSIRVV